MQSEIIFNARSDFGKGGAKKLRREAKVPCVITSASLGPVHVSLSSKVAEKMVKNASFFANVIEVNIPVEGKEQKVKLMPQKVDFHPVSSTVLHIDFLHIVGDVVLAEVPVKVVGADKAPGLKKGGKLNLVRYHLPLNCKISSIPEAIEVNIGTFGVGRSLFLSSLTLPKGVTMAYDCLVLSITGRGKKDKADEAAAAAAAPTATPAKAESK